MSPRRSWSGGVALAGAVLTGWFVLLALFLSRQPLLYDNDSYFHLAVARTYAEAGPVDRLEAVRFSVMEDGFGDKELLFHLLLVPFTVWLDPVFGGQLFLAALLLWPKVLPYMLAFNLHVAADRMWNHTESFWWPWFGWDVFWAFKPMNTPETMINVYLDIVTRYPQVWVVELIALAFLIGFGLRFQLYRWDRLRTFVMTGQVSAGMPA